MRKTTFQMSVECLCTSISAFKAVNKSYISTFMFQGSRNASKTIARFHIYKELDSNALHLL